MFASKTLYCAWLGLLCVTLLTPEARAGFTFLGPTPYLSAADSPFPVDGSNPNFYLEDFEPDEPCVPGEFVFCGSLPREYFGVEALRGGGGTGFSVDSDDGAIDGLGEAGISASVRTVIISGNSSYASFEVEFNVEELGYYPTAVGFVLTVGAGPGSGMIVYDRFGNEAVFRTYDLLLKPLETSDDRFIGVINPDGIARVVFSESRLNSQPPRQTRIDHLQYGLLVPELSSVGLACIASVACAGVVRRRPNGRISDSRGRKGTGVFLAFRRTVYA